MFFQRYDSDWVGNANYLAKQMKPDYDARDQVVQGLEEMYRRLDQGPRGVVFAYAGNGYWYCLSSSGIEHDVRLSIVDKKDWPGYYIERTAKEHFICNFDIRGKLQAITEVDVIGMNADRVSGLHWKYMSVVCTNGNTNTLIGAKFTLKKLQKYVDIFTAFQRTAGRML